MHINVWLKNKKIFIYVLTLTKDKHKQKSIVKLMKSLNLKKGVNWEFFKATTRSISSWQKALKNDFNSDLVEIRKNNIYLQ